MKPMLIAVLTTMCTSILIAISVSNDTRLSWYQPPQLFVMTGFIANTTDGIWGPDFIFNGEWNPQIQEAALAHWRKALGHQYDAEHVVSTFKESGASGVIFYDKWHDGLVFHQTELTQFKMDRDFLRETVDALRNHKMRSVIYYSVGLDNNPEAKFSGWTCLDAMANPVGLAFHSDWKSFHSPYRQYVIGQLVEIVKKYTPVDGFWLDVYGQPSRFYQDTYRWGPSYSHDRYTIEAFQSRFGKPIRQATDEEADNFVTDTLHDFLLEIRKAVSAEQPGVSFTWNGAGRDDIVYPRKAKLLNAPMDWFSLEGHTIPNIDLGSRWGQAMDRPFEVGMLLNSSWYVPLSDQAPPPAMSEDEAIVSAATAWIQGANVYAAVTPGHSGIYDENGDLHLLRAIGGWLKDNKSSLTGAFPYADAGILAGNPSPDLYEIPKLREMWRAFHRTLVDLPPAYGELGDRPGMSPDLCLRKAGYFTERLGSLFAGRKFDLKSYRMVVVPETALLDDKIIGEVREYVRNGGRILAFGHASLFEPKGKRRENFGLSDVFGVDWAGTLPGYKQFAITPGSGLVSGLPLNTGALAVKARSGKVLATWKSAGDTPAVVENQFGGGQSIYVSAEETAFGEGSALLRELVARLIGLPPITIEGIREYTLLMNRKGNDLLLYILNQYLGPRAADRSLRTMPFSAVEGSEDAVLKVDTAVLGAIRKVERIPSNQEVAFSQQVGSIVLPLKTFPAVTTLRFVKR